MYFDTSHLRFPDTSSAEPLTRIIDRLRHICCGVLHGHEMMMHREPERLALQCLHCGFTTPGWSIGVEERYRRTAAPIVPIEERMRTWSTTRWLRPPHTTHRAA